MMKALIIQEQHYMTLPNGEVWVDKQSEQRFWDRYLRVFDELIVFGRMREAREPDMKALRSDRPELRFVGIPDFRGIGGLLRQCLTIWKTLKRALAEADCVLLRAPSPISMVCYPLVARSGKPFAVELMNNPRTHYSREAMKKWYQPLAAAYITNQTKRMCRRANGVAYVTEQVLQGLYPSTARVKGESKDYFEASYSTIQLEEKDYICPSWGSARPEPLVFVHSGEMVDYRKGQTVVIDAAAQLRKRGYPIRVLFIGDGDKRAEFEACAARAGLGDDVRFAGWKSGFAQVQQELCKGHFFLFPSRGEGLPRSVIEAMASGLLCFGSNIDGVAELLDEDCLVEQFSGQAFADRIEPFLKDWSRSAAKREKQFADSKRYENSILSERRDVFYQKLAECAMRKQHE